MSFPFPLIQNGRLALTRDLGIVVSDELIKEQTARWLSIKAPESDDTVRLLVVSLSSPVAIRYWFSRL